MCDNFSSRHKVSRTHFDWFASILCHHYVAVFVGHLVRGYNRPDLLFFKYRIVSQHRLRLRISAHQRSSPRSKRRTRTGWPATLKCTLPAKLSIPTLLSTSIRPLSPKMSDLSFTLHSSIHVHACIICIQES